MNRSPPTHQRPSLRIKQVIVSHKPSSTVYCVLTLFYVPNTVLQSKDLSREGCHSGKCQISWEAVVVHLLCLIQEVSGIEHRMIRLSYKVHQLMSVEVGGNCPP
jgi:hypothetical protein